ncbi:P-loop containing nucleoside triphosphate hydrolase protein [Pavlovales sp. CCMP2436]|nr:P-loop containing nucleoside triphosphate hydrolase protein [Pavlovales sp. CCMP2436]
MDIISATNVFTASQERIDQLASTKAKLKDYNSTHPALRDELKHNPKVISIFNFKGGVGKTTVAINVAGMLAGLNKRVLVIDCDPQCNLTSFFVPPTNGAAPNAPAGTNPHALNADRLVDLQDVLKASTRSAIANLASLDQGAFAGRGIIDVNACMDGLGNGITSLNAPAKYFQPIPTDPNDPSVVGDRLLIIPGSSRIYDFDTTLNRMRGLPGEVMYQTALCTFVRQAAYLTNADFVIIDCGPSSSMLNKVGAG